MIYACQHAITQNPCKLYKELEVDKTDSGDKLAFGTLPNLRVELPCTCWFLLHYGEKGSVSATVSNCNQCRINNVGAWYKVLRGGGRTECVLRGGGRTECVNNEDRDAWY